MTSGRKALSAVRTIQKYCAERGCNVLCEFYNAEIKQCELYGKKPYKFPTTQAKKADLPIEECITPERAGV